MARPCAQLRPVMAATTTTATATDTSRDSTARQSGVRSEACHQMRCPQRRRPRELRTQLQHFEQSGLYDSTRLPSLSNPKKHRYEA